jgi:hypothetical protein
MESTRIYFPIYYKPGDEVHILQDSKRSTLIYPYCVTYVLHSWGALESRGTRECLNLIERK